MAQATRPRLMVGISLKMELDLQRTARYIEGVANFDSISDSQRRRSRTSLRTRMGHWCYFTRQSRSRGSCDKGDSNNGSRQERRNEDSLWRECWSGNIRKNSRRRRRSAHDLDNLLEVIKEVGSA